MKQNTMALILIGASLAGIVFLNSAYIVDQTEQAVITQFGEPMGGPIEEPGLHWKTPFFQDVHKFDKRILNWDGYPSEIPTRDKKFIWVDVTARWRIEDPLKYLQTVREERSAQSRLDDIVDGSTRNIITQYNLVEVVRSNNRILEIPTQQEDIIPIEYEKVEIGRDAITRKVLEESREKLKALGIHLLDIRIKRISYIESVQLKVYDRMVSERKRAAEQLRSEGQGVRAEIEGQREKDLKSITSEAYRKAQKIKGTADAEATKIFGEAYSKDPDFYAFMATLEKYPQTLQDGRLLLTTDSDFLKYLKKAES